MHLVSLWPGVMLATWNRALPASSSVRLTAPVAQSLPELRVVPLNAAYDDCHTRADAARMATGVAAAAAILPARAEGVRMKGAPRDGVVPLSSEADRTQLSEGARPH